MMTVGIDNGHPLNRVSFSKVLDHDGFDVHIAKPPGSMNDPHGMVARRSDQRKTPINLFVHYSPANGFGTASADKMRFCHDVGHIWNAEMYPLDILDRDQFRFEFPYSVNIQNTLLKNLVLGIKQAFLPFWMRRTDGPVKGWEKNKTCFVSGFKHKLLH
jgi:hypothetical protein